MPILDITLSKPLPTDLMKLLDRLLAVDLLGELDRERREGLEGEIGVDGLGAITGETGEVVHLARLPGLDHEADGGAQPLADQVVMHGRGREQRRDRRCGPAPSCGRTG